MTGGRGFLGSHLVAALRNDKDVDSMGISDVNTIQCNVSEKIPQINKHYDLVIHAAGKAHVVPSSKQEEQAFYDVNYQGTVNLVKGLDKAGFKGEFVFISTVAVYGCEHGEAINEEAPLKAVDPYGRSKIMAEEFLIEWAKNNDIVLTIVRLPLIAGKNAPGNLGAMIESVKKNRFAVIGNKNVKRSIILTSDVFSFISHIRSIGGTYNLSDGHHPSFAELGDTINRHWNKGKVKHIPRGVAFVIAVTGSILQEVLRREMPLNLRRYTKMTSSLTFCNRKAMATGWAPQSVLMSCKEWLG